MMELNSFLLSLLLVCYTLLCHQIEGCVRNAKRNQPPPDLFHSGKVVGRVNNILINEISGIAQSRRHKQIIYVLNDSGDMQRIFALNATNGNLEAIFTIKGALNCDWEDIAVGTGPLGLNYIYIGDIGGNTAATCNTIYRVVEPLVIRDELLDIHGELSFSWDAPNCETLMVDREGTLYLVSKVNPGQIPRLYKIPNVAWRFKKINLPQGTPVAIDLSSKGPVGGDISHTGREILIKTYEHVYYWRRALSTPLSEVLQQTPVTIPYIIEPQGEAICWARRDQGYYTVSEGPRQPIYYYDKKIQALFDEAVIRGHVRSDMLDEISGLAQSRIHPDVVYVLNDSGGQPRLFALNSTTAAVLAIYRIHNATNCDWEDLAVGRGPGDQFYIYIGDVGGNAWSVCQNIYRVVEPQLLEDSVLEIHGELHYTWPEPNCETIMVDEIGTLYLVSKVTPEITPRIYQIPIENFNQSYQSIVLSEGSTVNIARLWEGPVAGDISKTGNGILLKTYNSVWYWRRVEGHSIQEVLKSPPTQVSTYIREPQGKAICWDWEDEGFYTLGEGSFRPLYYYKQDLDYVLSDGKMSKN